MKMRMPATMRRRMTPRITMIPISPSEIPSFDEDDEEEEEDRAP